MCIERICRECGSMRIGPNSVSVCGAVSCCARPAPQARQ